MALEDALIGYAYAVGRCAAAWRFSDGEVRDTVGLALVSRAWDIFLRDAGKGEVGREHEYGIGAEALLGPHSDPRRNIVLKWLSDRAAPALANSAIRLTLAAGGRLYVDNEADQLIEAAVDALEVKSGAGPIARAISNRVKLGPALEGLFSVACAVDRLRADPAFTEAKGGEIRHALPHGSLSYYVPADPGAGWALNVALLLRSSPVAAVPAPGFCGRGVFRHDLEPVEVAALLVEQATSALQAVESLFEQTFSEIERGKVALTHLSRNARAGEAWKLVVAMGSISRSQLKRALKLSRAGADIQAHALAEAGLVELGANGRVTWVKRFSKRSPSDLLPSIDLRATAADLDASMAEIDRLLARPTPSTMD